MFLGLTLWITHGHGRLPRRENIDYHSNINSGPLLMQDTINGLIEVNVLDQHKTGNDSEHEQLNKEQGQQVKERRNQQQKTSVSIPSIQEHPADAKQKGQPQQSKGLPVQHKPDPAPHKPEIKKQQKPAQQKPDPAPHKPGIKEQQKPARQKPDPASHKPEIKPQPKPAQESQKAGKPESPKTNPKKATNEGVSKGGGQNKGPGKKTPVSSPSRPPPVVLATTNSAFLDFTKNWLESIRRLEVRPKNITIVAEDELTYRSLANYTEVHRVKPDVVLPPDKKLEFDSPAYKAFVNKRPKYILSLLEKGHDVLFSDVDTLWLQDPFKHFTGDYDIYIQEDQPPPKMVLCAGFVYYRNTPTTIQFVKKWIKRLRETKNEKPDQMILNIMIRYKAIKGLKLKILDRRKFLSGQHYFDEDWRRNNTDVVPVYVHNNWIIGHDVKVERFKQLGHWYV